MAGPWEKYVSGPWSKYTGGGEPESSDVVIAETDDGGRVVRRGDGSLAFVSPNYSTTDPAIIEELMKGAKTVAQTVQAGFDEQTIAQHPVAARANEFVRGVPFVGSYADEAVGLFGEGGRRARDAMRAATGAMQRQRPGQTMGLNIGGAIAGAIPMALAAGPAALARAPATRPGQAIVGGLLGLLGGGAEGAIYGAGEGTTGAERAAESGRQAKIGAGLGATLGFLSPFAAEGFQVVAERFRQSDIGAIAEKFGVSRETAQVLRKAFQNNDQAAYDNIMKAGQEATMADAGRSGQALLDAAAQTGGRPMNIVDAATDARVARSGARATEALDATLGPYQGPLATAREVARESAPRRNAAYEAAYNTAIDYSSAAGRKIEDVISRVPSDTLAAAVREANEEMQAKGIRNMQILFDMDTGKFVEMPNVQQLDELKKALQGLASENVDQFGRPTQRGMRNGRLATELRDATVDATGGETGTYARALEVGGDKIELDRGLELGLDMLRQTKNTTREAVSERLKGLSQDAREMVKRGVRHFIDETIGNVKVIASAPDGQDAAATWKAIQLLTTPNSREKLRALLGPQEADALMAQLDETIQSYGMKASVATNSKTAVRQAIQKETDDVIAPGVLGQLARGEPVNATKELTQTLLGTTKAADAATREQIWSEIATVLSEQRGNRTAAQALRYVEDAIAGQPLNEARARFIANATIDAIGLSGLRAGQAIAQ